MIDFHFILSYFHQIGHLLPVIGALNPNDSAAYGMYRAVKDAESVFGPTNKVGAHYPGSNASREAGDEYTSKMSDSEILDLTAAWKRDFRKYYESIEKDQEKAFDYWIGKQTSPDMTLRHTTSDPTLLTDNVIFTMVETMLPLITRANPDPVVTSDPGDAGETASHAIQAALVYEADRQKLRKKLSRLVRRWAWDKLGVVKIYWDVQLKEICTEVIPAKRFIFDKDGYIDEGGNYCGDYLGERKKKPAKQVIEMFADGKPELKLKIREKADQKMDSKLEFVEWWYKGREVFYTLDDDTVLGKFKNPNWNYDIPGQEATEESRDEEGNIVPAQPEVKEQEGVNFHKEPKPPYVFLSIFSSGTQPYDETSLILQNTQLQDIVNRRVRQIDKNVEKMNGFLAIAGKVFTNDQAAQAASAADTGKNVFVPGAGDVRAAIARVSANPLPPNLFEQLEDMRGEIMNIGGTAGSTPQGLEQTRSVRGKIMIQQQDASRFSHITESLEQVADTIYNWWVQFMFVYYDEEHFVTSAGLQGGVELISIKNQMFQFVKMLDITVKEGTLIPKDPLTKRNEAMDLWGAQAIDPVSFYKRLDDADPVKSAELLILWELGKAGNLQALQAYMPSLPIFQQQPQPGQPGQPSQPGQQGTPQPPPQGQSAPPGSPPAVQAQESALLKSVPLPNV